MKKRNIRALTVILFLGAMALLLSGCTSEEVIDKSNKVSAIAGKLLVVTPPAAAPFLALIGAIATAVGATATAITQYRGKAKMKKAIVAKSDQIDKVILASKGNPQEGKEPILDFLKADMRLADGERLKALNTFDNIRKGVI